MNRVFSPQSLRIIGIFALAMLILYLAFLIFPYLTPFVRIVQAILVPFLISMIIAYLLHPLVDLLMKTRLNRTLSILVLYILFFGALGCVLWFGTPVFIEQLRDLMNELPQIQKTILIWLERFEMQLQRLPDGIHLGINDALLSIQSDSRHTISQMVEGAGKMLDKMFALVVIPFLVFYFLLDAEIMNKTIYHLIPTSKRKMALDIWKDIDHSLGEYIRGQIMISLVVGLLSLIGYFIIGLPYTLFLAGLMAVTNIIPYFGPFIGIAPAILVALLTKPSLVLWVIVINLIIQIIEGNILAPWIVGKRLHIHPVFIILSLLLGHQIGGVVGLILAVPIFVAGKVVLEHLIEHTRRARQIKEGGNNQQYE
ncbi:AI-2E family transporter [Bacillus horti]|uniref:PurR-regulated permease PerM n=1 Tax=Caldalkalibacillus horti TaxID=77523 RepID=A0ABT9VUB4_9BACI|nr:AI-2E family transporter [Bacillus horti]MDQ0164220.1 putative PurR-regulated permease PerM [Bacillus horti]